MSAPDFSRASTATDLAPTDGLMHQDADAYRNKKAAGVPVANQTLDMRRATDHHHAGANGSPTKPGGEPAAAAAAAAAALSA